VLGQRAYEDLPRYVAGWDVALLPFARNESTRFISPTKTPEYLAAGRPVVSTSIRDVVRPYGDEGLVEIADEPEAFASAATGGRTSAATRTTTTTTPACSSTATARTSSTRTPRPLRVPLDDGRFELVSVSDLGLTARRPPFSALASERGWLLPPWENAVERHRAAAAQRATATA
jgi:hypothetical protein